MSHISKITEQRRALFVLLIDQSGSMSEPYGIYEDEQIVSSKAQYVAKSANGILSDIVSRCKQGFVYRHYFDIVVVGYSGGGVYSLLPHQRWVMSPAELVASTLRVECKQRRQVNQNNRRVLNIEPRSVWIEPKAEGRTPMLAALERLSEILYRWRENQSALLGFPPTIIHITDGEPTDAHQQQLLSVCQRIETLGTDDGSPILFNVHISRKLSQSVLFPEQEQELPREAQLLYRLSSRMPKSFSADIADIKEHSDAANRSYRALGYNTSVNDFIRIVNIGTTTTNHIE